MGYPPVVAVIRPPAPGPDHTDEPEDQPEETRGRWWAVDGWVDRHAWTIVVVGVALILLDVLAILALVLIQVTR